MKLVTVLTEICKKVEISPDELKYLGFWGGSEGWINPNSTLGRGRRTLELRVFYYPDQPLTSSRVLKDLFYHQLVVDINTNR
jgi:hypothetical protein